MKEKSSGIKYIRRNKYNELSRWLRTEKTVPTTTSTNSKGNVSPPLSTAPIVIPASFVSLPPPFTTIATTTIATTTTTTSRISTTSRNAGTPSTSSSTSNKEGKKKQQHIREIDHQEYHAHQHLEIKERNALVMTESLEERLIKILSIFSPRKKDENNDNEEAIKTFLGQLSASSSSSFFCSLVEEQERTVTCDTVYIYDLNGRTWDPVCRDLRPISGPPSWRHGPLGQYIIPAGSWVRGTTKLVLLTLYVKELFTKLTLTNISFFGSMTSGIPGGPENITVMFLNPTSVRVSWSTSQVEQVEKYDVTYRPTDASNLAVSYVSNKSVSYRVVAVVAGNSEAVTLSGLRADTQYQLVVTAVRAGRKYKSRPIVFRTLEPPRSFPQQDAAVTNGPLPPPPPSSQPQPYIQIRGVEVGIVILVLIVWAGAIALFFNRWGKIRMLLPYQPDYKEQLKVPGTGVCTATNTAYPQHSTQHTCSQILAHYDTK
ncbi:hypothetical protein M0802_011759 [Mischocyttarus mexicanus]|nr:hypothetical protein M0802_011759 [Mischocyttarus mexicanus]